MEEYFNSKKYIILLVVVCILFTIMTVKVFEYMPKPLNNQEAEEYSPQFINNKNDSEYNNEQDENTYAENSDDEEYNEEEDDDEDEDDDKDSSVEEKQQKSGHIDFMPKSSYQNLNDLEEIPAPKGTNEEKIQAYDTN